MIWEAYFLKASQYPDNINLIETGLFHRFDATNILKENLASVITSIGLDHLDWLPKNQQTVEKIIFEKTSTLLNSNIIVKNYLTDDQYPKVKRAFNAHKEKCPAYMTVRDSVDFQVTLIQVDE